MSLPLPMAFCYVPSRQQTQHYFNKKAKAKKRSSTVVSSPVDRKISFFDTCGVAGASDAVAVAGAESVWSHLQHDKLWQTVLEYYYSLCNVPHEKRCQAMNVYFRRRVKHKSEKKESKKVLSYTEIAHKLGILSIKTLNEVSTQESQTSMEHKSDSDGLLCKTNVVSTTDCSATSIASTSDCSVTSIASTTVCSATSTASTSGCNTATSTASTNGCNSATSTASTSGCNSAISTASTSGCNSATFCITAEELNPNGFPANVSCSSSATCNNSTEAILSDSDQSNTMKWPSISNNCQSSENCSRKSSFDKVVTSLEGLPDDCRTTCTSSGSNSLKYTNVLIEMEKELMERLATLPSSSWSINEDLVLVHFLCDICEKSSQGRTKVSIVILRCVKAFFS